MKTPHCKILHIVYDIPKLRKAQYGEWRLYGSGGEPTWRTRICRRTQLRVVCKAQTAFADDISFRVKHISYDLRDILSAIKQFGGSRLPQGRVETTTTTDCGLRQIIVMRIIRHYPRDSRKDLCKSGTVPVGFLICDLCSFACQ